MNSIALMLIWVAIFKCILKCSVVFVGQSVLIQPIHNRVDLIFACNPFICLQFFLFFFFQLFKFIDMILIFVYIFLFILKFPNIRLITPLFFNLVYNFRLFLVKFCINIITCLINWLNHFVPTRILSDVFIFLLQMFSSLS